MPTPSRAPASPTTFQSQRGRYAGSCLATPSTTSTCCGSATTSLLRRRRNGRQAQHAFRYRVHLLLRERDGEVLPLRPDWEQIPVVRVVGIARLAWRVQADRVIPILGVGDDLQGTTRGLIVAATRGAHRGAVAASRSEE